MEKDCRNFRGRFVKGHRCRTILAIAEVVTPVDETIPVPIDGEELLREVDTFLLLVGKLKRIFVLAVLFMINYLIPFLFLKPGQFSNLKPEDRHHILSSLHSSRIFPIRGLYLITSMLILPYYYSRPQVLEQIGYPFDRFYDKREVA